MAVVDVAVLAVAEGGSLMAKQMTLRVSREQLCVDVTQGHMFADRFLHQLEDQSGLALTDRTRESVTSDVVVIVVEPDHQGDFVKLTAYIDFEPDDRYSPKRIVGGLLRRVAQIY